MRLGDAVPGMQALGLVGIFVPGMGHEFLDLVGIAKVDRVNFGEIAVDDRALRQQQVRRRIIIGVFGHVAIGQHRLARQAAAIEPVLVERSDGHDVRQIDLIVEFDGPINDFSDVVQALHIDRADAADAVHVDRAGHAAHQPVRMRVLAAEDGVDLDDLLLEIERFEIMRHRHQIGLGRQVIGLAAPIAVLERPELAGLDENASDGPAGR